MYARAGVVLGVAVMRWALSVVVLAVSTSACVPADRAFREISGPARLRIDSPWGVSMDVEIEDGGRYFAGPEFDSIDLYETASEGQPDVSTE